MFIEVHTLYKSSTVKNKNKRMKTKVFKTKKEAVLYAKRETKKTGVWFSSVDITQTTTGKHTRKIFGTVPKTHILWLK